MDPWLLDWSFIGLGGVVMLKNEAREIKITIKWASSTALFRLRANTYDHLHVIYNCPTKDNCNSEKFRNM